MLIVLTFTSIAISFNTYRSFDIYSKNVLINASCQISQKGQIKHLN